MLVRASCPFLSTFEMVCLPELSSSNEMLPIHRTADTKRNMSSCSLSDSPTCKQRYKQVNKQVNNMVCRVFVCLFICLDICLFIYLLICLLICLFVCLFVYALTLFIDCTRLLKSAVSSMPADLSDNGFKYRNPFLGPLSKRIVFLREEGAPASNL